MNRSLFQKLYLRSKGILAKYLYFLRPQLSVVVLSWNRDLLLKQTIYSLIANSKLVSEIIIVDNNSNTELKNWIKLITAASPKIKALFLSENTGGLAINKGLEQASGKYIFISENDLEFLPNWDVEMLEYFKKFKNLGQLSPFSPFPEESKGEVWGIKNFKPKQIGDSVLNIAEQNVGTSCLIPRKIYELGVRFGSLESTTEGFNFPSDAQFSNDIKKLGLDVAWANKYHVTNWGHNQSIWKAFPEYFNNNFQEKKKHSIDGLTNSETVEVLMQKNDSLNKKIQYLKSLSLIPEKHWQAINFFERSYFYFDIGKGFQESSKISEPLILDEFSNFKLTFTLPDCKSFYNFRWDPIEGFGCEINELEIKIIGQSNQVLDISTYESNSLTTKENILYFDTSDPYLSFKNLQENPIKVIISGNIKIIYNKNLN